MTDQPKIKWYHAFEAKHGKKLSGPEVAAWEDEIRNRVKNLMASEVNAAVRTCKSRTKYAPTVDDLIEAIYHNKRASKQPHYGEPFHTLLMQNGEGSFEHYREPASIWQSRLKGCHDPIEAWNIICEPCEPEQCRERIAFCENKNIQYQRFVAQHEYTTKGVIHVSNSN